MGADHPPPRPRPGQEPGPVVRKDADGVRSIGPTWESVTERLIREAQERGEFDDLPGQGQRLTVDDNPYAADMALAYHVLRNAGTAPAWIEADKEVRRLRHLVEQLARQAPGAAVPARATLRRRLAAALADHDAAVARLNAEAPTSRQHRAPLGTDLLRRLDEAWSARR